MPPEILPERPVSTDIIQGPEGTPGLGMLKDKWKPAEVSILGTDGGINTINSGNKFSNETYPVVDPYKRNEASSYYDKNTDTTTTLDLQGNVVKQESGNATYANVNGQEANYTQEQLNDPNVQQFIKDGGYELVKSSGLGAKTNGLESQANQAAQQVEDYKSEIRNWNVETDPAFQQQAAGIRAEFDKLKKEMQKTNYQRQRAYETLGIRGGATQYTGGREGVLAGIRESVQEGIEEEEISQGSERINEIVRQENAAISAARTAFKTGKWVDFGQQIELLKDTRNEKAKALTDYNTTVANAVKNQQEQSKNELDNLYKKIQIQKAQQEIVQQNVDSYASAFIDFDEKGNVISADPEQVKQFSDASGIPYEQIVASIRTKSFELSKLSQEDKLKELQISQARRNLLGEEVASWQDAIQNGWTKASSPAEYQAEKKNFGKINTSAGNVPLTGNNSVDISNTTNSNSNSILSQTGLSLPTFNYLTQGTPALTRMSATQRLQYMGEAERWANSQGIDVSTFQSRYEAYNNALQSNIKRANLVKVAEGEIQGTLENLAEAADEASFGNMRVANVAKLWAGQEFNDKNVSKYAFHLNQLKSEMALYNSAASGKTSTDDADYKEAERIIKEGLATGTIVGFTDALKNSVEKMDQVLQANVDRTNEQVWELFGVGRNYKTTKEKNEFNKQFEDFYKSYKNPLLVEQMLSDPEMGLTIEERKRNIIDYLSKQVNQSRDIKLPVENPWTFPR